MKRTYFKKRFVLPAIFIIGFGILAATKPEDKYFEIAKNLDIFATTFKEVNTYYVDEINPNTLIKAGIEAMLASLDPYTNFIGEDEIEDYRTMTTGQYGGIGAIVGRRNNKNIVLMPYEDQPAHKAGLRIGDEFVEIDGINITTKTTTDVSKLLRGQAGTKVKLKINRFGQKESFVVEILRQKIKVASVPYFGMVDNQTGYLHLTDFTSDASREVRKAITILKEKGAQKIIFDLRDNPGGLLSEAVNVSNLFVPKDKEIVSTKGKVSEWNKVYKTLNPALDTQMPLIILTSDRSASASEIVAGVVQDYDRGVLVGERTFGKGLVQATRPLSYNAQLKVTTAKYYTPSGRCIQAIDYSHRGKDGSVKKFADSLHTAFLTAAGRKVYDGGGVVPEIEVKHSELAPITISLIQKNLLFDYATQYAAAHSSIASAKDFKLSESEYADFVKWLQTKEYDYTTKAETDIKNLTVNSKKEKYFEDIRPQIEALTKRLAHNKDNDLMSHKIEIQEYLEQEIVSRYYLEKGIKEASLNADEDLQAALKVFADMDAYNKLLKSK